MDFSDLNVALYRCDQEEKEETDNKYGVYDVPGYGSLVYAGLQGNAIFNYVHLYVCEKKYFDIFQAI